MINKIISRLRNELTSFNNSVFALANIEDVEKKISIDGPSIYVIHVDDVIDSNDKNTRNIKINHNIALLVVLPIHKDDHRGEAAQQYLFDFRYTLLSVLYGWRIQGNFSQLNYLGSRFQKISGNLAQHLYKFSCEEHMNVSDFGIGSLNYQDYYNLVDFKTDPCGEVSLVLEKVNE